MDTFAVAVVREEITVIGRLPEPDGEDSAARASGKVSRFRDETRSARMRIADEAQHKYGRKMSWGAEVGSERILFTHIAVPVMTRPSSPNVRCSTPWSTRRGAVPFGRVCSAAPSSCCTAWSASSACASG